MAETLDSSNQTIEDDANSCMERMRRHLCTQFEIDGDSEWPAVLMEAGLSHELRSVSDSDRSSAAFRKSIEQKLDRDGVEILEQMQMHRIQLIQWVRHSSSDV